MDKPNTVKSIRFRYIIGLSAIAILITTSFMTMHRVVSQQRDFSAIVNLAGHQAGLSNRIAYFASLMATTDIESEFNMARSQVGRTIHKMRNAHEMLINGDPEKNIPKVTNDNLDTIYYDPMVGLDQALHNFLERATKVYESDMESLHAGSAAFLFLTTYGPHVLEPMLEAAVDEYQKIGREAILKIERFELFIWVATLITLVLEAFFIFYPLERHIRNTLNSLHGSIIELTNMSKRLEAAQKIALVGDWELDTRRDQLTWSAQVYEICGVSPANFVPDPDNSLALIHPEDQPTVKKALKRCVDQKKSTKMEYRIILPDGQERLIYQQAEVKQQDEEFPTRVQGIMQDITERKELSARLEKLSEHIPGFIFQLLLDSHGTISFSYVSKGVYATCGIEREHLIEDSTTLTSLFPHEDLTRLFGSLTLSGEQLTTWHESYRLNHPEKGEIWLEGQASPEKLPNNSILWHGYIMDITDRKLSEKQIKKLALYDPLTGLANRRLLKDRLQHAIATSCRNNNYGAVILLDMDNFKSLNDTKGHNVGDSLLVEVAGRLHACVRETDTVARLGGDEFVVILEWLGSNEEEGCKKALAVTEKIRVALNRVYVLGEDQHKHHASASIGVAMFQGNQNSEGELLKRADLAMYEAKDFGRNKACLYSEKRQSVIKQRAKMAADLQRALNNEEFSLFFQPQVTSNGALCGAEALLRWFPEGGKPISPAEFIPVAESTNFIQPLGEWVLKRTCQHLLELSRYTLPDNFAVAVNISARQFSDNNFIDKVRDALTQSGLPTHFLKLELTESCLVQDMERGRNILSEFRNMGLRIELDDFGTGYSSLTSLSKLPLNTLKIDRSLIHALGDDEQGKAIVRAVIAMAKTMSLDTIAEGVETMAQSEFLRKEGCDMLQGFLIAKPMPFKNFLQYLESSQKSFAMAKSATAHANLLEKLSPKLLEK